jgi:thioredoxin-related protein
MRKIWRLVGLIFISGLVEAAEPRKDSALDAGLVNPGYQEHPAWFKQSFLDIREDVAEAAEDGKRVILYFYQDGCPYCAKLLRENFSDSEIVESIRGGFDTVAVNIWGDREVIGFLGEPTSEKAFAAGLKVQFTPTMLLLDEQGRVVLRINGYFPPHKFLTALEYVIGRREQKGESFQDYFLARNPKAATGKLPEEGGFLARPLRLADHQSGAGRPLVVLFEQAACVACDELHGDILRREPVAYALTNLDAAIVDTWSREPIQTPEGRELPARAWAAELGIEYTPSLVFFDPAGREVFRTEGYLRTFHVHGALDYVSTQAYRRQPSFQRYLQERRTALESRGFSVDLMD